MTGTVLVNNLFHRTHFKIVGVIFLFEFIKQRGKEKSMFLHFSMGFSPKTIWKYTDVHILLKIHIFGFLTHPTVNILFTAFGQQQRRTDLKTIKSKD